MSDNPASTETTDFGFRRVPRAAKRGMVRAVFDSVAPRYDLMNDLMSLGVHRAWKQRAGDGARSAVRGGRCWIWRRAPATSALPGCEQGGGPALLSDVNASMLDVARDRALSRGLIGGASLVVADAERLPLPDRVVDRVSIAFGLRNCTDKPAVLAEARRVLRPGGRFFCLEFSHVQVAALQPLYDAWSFRVLPMLGRASRMTKRAIAIWRRASGHSLTRRRWPGCCGTPGLRAWRCAICRAASRRSIQDGGCDGQWSSTDLPLPLREGVGGGGRRSPPPPNPLPQGEGEDSWSA